MLFVYFYSNLSEWLFIRNLKPLQIYFNKLRFDINLLLYLLSNNNFVSISGVLDLHKK